jgi:hypothetical protein
MLPLAECLVHLRVLAKCRISTKLHDVYSIFIQVKKLMYANWEVKQKTVHYTSLLLPCEMIGHHCKSYKHHTSLSKL